MSDVLTFSTSGEVRVYRKWKNGGIAWSRSIWDALSLRFQGSVLGGVGTWSIVGYTVGAESADLGII